MLRDMLTLASAVTVVREVAENDGMGGLTVSTTETVLTVAQIWQSGSGRPFISEQIAKSSTHVLAIETGEYSFAGDEKVSWNGDTFKVVGYADDVANQGEITTIGLERIRD